MAKGIVGKYKFVCNRKVENGKGELTGSVKAYVPAEENTIYAEYKCPECSFSEKTSQEWKRPFNIKCRKCGYLIRIPKLKDQVKREKKAEKAAKV
jgi:hypothetical protein